LFFFIDTSRPKKDTEINSKDEEAEIGNRRFVEYGKYEKSYYGTTLNAIWDVVNAGKYCVLNLHPESLKILKDSDLMPFVVFVAPTSLEKLRAKRKEKGEAVKVNKDFVYFKIIRNVIKFIKQCEFFTG